MEKTNFDGYDQYSFGSGQLRVSVVTFGATVTSLRFQGRETVLRYDTVDGYRDGTDYLCAQIGRYANRIRDARFPLNGREIRMPANEGNNQLHGGPSAFDQRRWDAQVLSDSALRMSLFSPDGDNGYPGNLTASVTYSVTENTLRMDFEACADADTVYAPTSHLYFNLDGEKDVRNYRMRIPAEGWLEVDEALIPTGRVLPAEGSFDFSSLRRIGQDYDHCFVLKGENACTVEAGELRLDVDTSMPAVQIYTASGMGAPHGAHGGLAIEPEFYPDSPNHPAFPSTLLRAGQHFHHWASYRFCTR